MVIASPKELLIPSDHKVQPEFMDNFFLSVCSRNWPDLTFIINQHLVGGLLLHLPLSSGGC